MRYRTAALATALVFALSILGTSGPGLTQEKEKGAKGGPQGQGRAPHIHAAMKSLEHAAHQLEKADHHFGGHRAKALELVKQAEGELKLAIEYAKAHPDGMKKTSTTK